MTGYTPSITPQASKRERGAERPNFSYRAFGLNISSELECGGLLTHPGLPDVHVRLGRVPAKLAKAGMGGIFYQAEPEQLLLRVDGVASFLVSSGTEIIVDVARGADPGLVLLVLLGSAFGALLQQRRVWVIHGSAIATAYGAVIFSGASGYGKSTLAGMFHRRGFPVLADDLCTVRSPEGLPVVWPANPFLLLWADSVTGLGIDRTELQAARSGLEKYILPVGDTFAADPMPLRAVYLLEPGNSDQFSLLPIRGLQKVKALNLATYRPHFIESMSVGTRYFSEISEVARMTRVVRVVRPRWGLRIEELADLLAGDFAR